jgi:hypothetical protein
MVFDARCCLDTACNIYGIGVYLSDGILNIFRGESTGKDDR